MGYRGASSAWISASPRFDKLSDAVVCDAVAMLLHLGVAPPGCRLRVAVPTLLQAAQQHGRARAHTYSTVPLCSSVRESPKTLGVAGCHVVG